MPKTNNLHPHSDRQAFDRLILLIATFIHHPGIGCPDRLGMNSQTAHESLENVQAKVYELAQQYNIPLTKYSIPTLRKDLVTLRKYGLLEKRIYRWGYFLGTGVMSFKDLQVALNALNSMAKYQRSPQAIRIYQELEQKLRGKQILESADYLYPVRSQIDRAIIYTDLDEMLDIKKNRYNLYHCLEQVESAIAIGQAITIYRYTDPYSQKIGYLQVFPLQLIYRDIAWYLLYEYVENGHIEIERIDRFTDQIQFVNQPRGTDLQKSSLNVAMNLFKKGWGLFLGEPSEQAREIAGTLEYVQIKIRFFAPVIAFIEEGEKRHISQVIDRSGKPDYIDYSISLPPRSLNEFCRWVHQFVHHAQVLEPKDLRDRFRFTAQRLAALYNTSD
ncbi:MAG: WYL domain-containing protein [Pseudanabaena sp. M57BS1SP1A06MG]|nr:WYL domain-containing protein [Pseudanabaena sp. M53BS1SP1A06MG]MCA6582975.1 WYL domain-containing protein [Pseudanabaena sp. M34BS1SP1A06MG]MCA6592692.1 WYL domain-containing protein [Pseudanabaena sp. M38BS1SP1A06MG]MCA6601901.1 WYL domain-containing protein [Pseudanabaena sp. M57BS1SP1A06MG]